MLGDRDSYVCRMMLCVVDKFGVSGLWLSLELVEGISWFDCVVMVGFRWCEGVLVVYVVLFFLFGVFFVESLFVLELVKVILS